MEKTAKLVQTPPGAGTNDVVFVARQPIYTREAQLFAYQLLYGRDVVERALSTKNGNASGEPFLNAFLGLSSMESLVGENVAFVSVARKFILQDYCATLAKEKAVLEISPGTEIDENVLCSLKTLRDAGYKLALDSFAYSIADLPLLEIANYASLDFARLTPDEIFGQISLIAQSKAKAIARNIESHEGFEIAKRLGFEYFAGPCFNKPAVSTPVRVPINRLSTLQLALKLQNPELTAEEVEKFVSQDLAISYKLLRFVNSAALSLARNIESIKHAIQMVGTTRIRGWASLLLLSKLEDKPAELMVTALVRAKMSEGIAVAMGFSNPDSYYMVGLFSVVDALLNVTLPEAIQLLPFSKQVREALLNHEGQMGSVLKCVLNYERGDWEGVILSNLDPVTIRQSYLDAISAAQKMPKG